MYKPQYLNIDRQEETVYAGNNPYWSRKTVTPLGYRKKPPEKKLNKSGRRFAGKVR